MGYVIDLCGELTEVELSFFTKIKIVRHDTIGSVHFIGIRGFTIYGSSYTFNIADTIWQYFFDNNKFTCFDNCW